MDGLNVIKQVRSFFFQAKNWIKRMSLYYKASGIFVQMSIYLWKHVCYEWNHRRNIWACFYDHFSFLCL